MCYPIVAFLSTILILFFLVNTRLSRIALDQPNHRSLHTKVTPRTGGLAIMSAVLISGLLIGNLSVWLFLIVALIGVSLVDDIRGLAVRWRFTAQFIISAIFISIFLPSMAWWMQASALLALVWMTNLYNFMDGSDGLAGGMALFGFASYAIAAYIGGNIELALMCACIVASSMAFLLFNFYPAKIFMGDAGSIPLGFLAGAIGLYGWQQGLWTVWFSVLVFSPFIVDSTVTLVKRLLLKERVWQAHRNHYYQRLIQMGSGHCKTAIFEYVLMFLVGATAVFLLKQSMIVMFFGLLFWIVVYFLLMQMIDKSWTKMQSENGLSTINLDK